jgi:F-type H+-transporting ATPase subunit gamma
MARERKIKLHLRRLKEIRNIMEAMKNLAVLETHKLGAILDNQKLLLQDLEGFAGDFLTHHPHLAPAADAAADVWLLFGSERGFCGDFNEALLERLNREFSPGQETPHLIPVGKKLCTRLQEDPRVFAFVEGADVAEETPAVLNTLIRHIASLQAGHNRLNVFALYRDADTDELVTTQLLPPFREAAAAAPRPYPPLLNLQPETFYLDLVDRYLFVALQDIASTSLMAENYRRIQHMTGAIRRLEENEERLLRKYHIQRQEEIIEEIEVILLNAAAGP